MSEQGIRTLLTIEPSAEAPRNSEGSLIRLADGTLYLAYSRFTGGTADNARAEIACRVSRDGGQTWSGDTVLVPNEGRQNVMSVSLLRLKSGGVLLFYLVKNGWDDCKLYTRRSDDEMASLGERICATPHEGYHVVNNDRVVQLCSGRLIVPAARHPSPGNGRGQWSRRGMALCFLSDNEGRHWRPSRSILEAPAESASGLQEPGVVELADGRLYMWMRTDLGWQYESFSEDGGDTWSRAQPSSIASPLSPASIKRVPWSGDLLLVWNDHSGRHSFLAGKRTPLCLALSADEGRTWGPSRVIESDPDGWYCYTSITFLDKAVILGYCAGDSQVGRLNRLKLTWVHADWFE